MSGTDRVSVLSGQQVNGTDRTSSLSDQLVNGTDMFDVLSGFSMSDPDSVQH